MESRIRLLSETTVNRIAAGEVVERPAAAVKELVENALDAGARRIAVTLVEGGTAAIEVVDDGCGMNPAELALAVRRHATSKLAPDAHEADALLRIATLGFRGEALPSIGAVARLALTSRPPGAPYACTVRVEGGQVSDVAPCAGPAGTRAIVRDLFFATPARRKFLKHPRTEAEHAEAAVRRLALAAPEVAFRLESDGQALFDLPAQGREARVAALLGAEAASLLLAVDAAREALRLEGYAAAPTLTRTTAAAQHVVVNGRPVADPVLRTAIRVAYRDVIAAGRHPVVALFLSLPPGEVDQNVHPAKTELRFRDPALVRGFVIAALRAVLAGGAGRAVPVPTVRPFSTRAPGWSARVSGFAEPPGSPFWREPAGAALPLAAAPAARMVPAPDPPADQHPLGAPVAQVLDTYIVAVAGDGSLVLVDQHAAHERLTHEALRAQTVAGEVRGQPLLLPAVVELGDADAARLLARAGELARLGVEIEAFGGAAVLVRALPAALGAPDPRPLLQDVADELASLGESTALEARLDAVLARLACHGSIRAGRRLGAAEMAALLRQLEATPRAATCSHGRPTVLKLSRGEIERLFGRR